MTIRKISEASEQEGFVTWFRLKYPGVLIFHIPNGEHRALSVGVRLKKLGVVAGVPDLFIPSWKLWLEIKRADGGTVSPKQKAMMEYLTRVGYKCLMVHGATDASKQVLNFVKDRENNK